MTYPPLMARTYPPDSTLKDDEVFQIELTALFSEDADFLEIPIRLSGNLILLEARVNGKKGQFIFDSGAPDLIINDKYFQDSRIIQQSKAQGVGGRIAEVNFRAINHFAWKGSESKKFSVQCIDLSHLEKVRREKIMGLIGFQLFKKYEILLDYFSSRLILYKLNKFGQRLYQKTSSEQVLASYPLKMIGHLATLEARIAQHKLRFGIDTGAETNILDIGSRPRVLQHFRILKRAVLQGNDQRKVEVLKGKIQNFKIGQTAYPQLDGILTSMKNLNRGYGTDLDGVLGFHFLSRYPSSINFIKKEFTIWRVAPSKVEACEMDKK